MVKMKTDIRFVRGGLIVLAGVLIASIVGIVARDAASAANGAYKILAWNDLGMHCYNRDFSDLAVLPPYNTLWVQVVKAGDPPEVVTTGITVEYYYQDNTYSVGKTNFWDYDQALFGVNLPPNVGLKGKGLSGTMDLAVDHFVAEGIPLTEFSDSAPMVSQPYQQATVIVKDSVSGQELARTQVVTPVSSEMRCDNCHGNNGIAKPDNPTGKVETNILQLHDEEEGTTLMADRPVLCANCHGSNALGMAGQAGLKNLSNAMHSKHDGIVSNTLDGCYNCHPGPQTKCLRDVMSTNEGMTCINCHGGMSKVASNPNPWLNEPRCDTCHDSGSFNQDHALYRFSKGHGDLYCSACHDSTHAIAPSREAADSLKFIALQGENGPLEKCSVCHTSSPVGGGPHASTPPTGNATFDDVDGTHWAFTWIERIYNDNITGGCSTTPLKYCPDDSVTRAQMAVFLDKGMAYPSSFTPPNLTPTFTDTVGHWAEDWIEALKNHGVTSGCATGLYCPEDPVTRAQMAVFLLKAEHGASYSPPAATGVFTDVPVGFWADKWIEQLAREGITGGCATGLYCPNDPVTRAQMAVFLAKTFSLP
jgi:hypothetical protein